MRLVIGVLLLAIATGFATGGRLRGLAGLRFRWTPLAVVGLALQLVSPSMGPWPFALLLASFVLLAMFAARNLAIAGFALILAGMSLNFIVIALNHGMPVTRGALVASGQEATLTELLHDGGAKHHLSGADDRLLFLGDATAIPAPIGQIVSAGDIVAYMGVGYVVVAAMRRGRRPDGSGDHGLQRLERIPVSAGAREAADG